MKHFKRTLFLASLLSTAMLAACGGADTPETGGAEKDNASSGIEEFGVERRGRRRSIHAHLARRIERHEGG
ncbi:MAG: hypothetical protein ACR2N0_05195 [Rubrobacteraceae bacterium]|nr:hypothetical protein [Rubrobacter sp.]